MLRPSDIAPNAVFIIQNYVEVKVFVFSFDHIQVNVFSASVNIFGPKNYIQRTVLLPKHHCEKLDKVETLKN